MAGASIPMGQGYMSPNIYEGETSMVMSPNILFSNSNNCCLLYFNANIMCSFTNKFQLLGDFVPQTPYWGSAPGPRWGTSISRTPSLLLCPPSNPVRSTPLLYGPPISILLDPSLLLVGWVEGYQSYCPTPSVPRFSHIRRFDPRARPWKPGAPR